MTLEMGDLLQIAYTEGYRQGMSDEQQSKPKVNEDALKEALRSKKRKATTIRARMYKKGTETIIKGFACDVSPSDMLLVTKALRHLMYEGDCHPEDRRRLEQLIDGVNRSLKVGEYR